MKYKHIILIFLVNTALNGCNSGSGNEVNGGSVTPPSNFPDGYTCLPFSKNFPLIASNKIAFADNCLVSNSSQSVSLEGMSVAMMRIVKTRTYAEYCTATPVSFDPTTQTGFLVTAAHCVISHAKVANTPISNKNIGVFDEYKSYLYQGPNSNNYKNSLTGVILAVYVPVQYCQVPAIKELGFGRSACEDFHQQNGDIALLKFQVNSGQKFKLNPQVKLAPENLSIAPSSLLLALGYGLTNKDPYNSSLYYVNYQYFATNSYAGLTSEASLMNGYYANRSYHSIICAGDSGGGDFYWDGSNWLLTGVHSYGAAGCGVSNSKYREADDVSADIRPFSSSLQNIINNDSGTTTCNEQLATQNGFICQDRNNS